MNCKITNKDVFFLRYIMYILFSKLNIFTKTTKLILYIKLIFHKKDNIIINMKTNKILMSLFFACSINKQHANKVPLHLYTSEKSNIESKISTCEKELNRLATCIYDICDFLSEEESSDEYNSEFQHALREKNILTIEYQKVSQCIDALKETLSKATIITNFKKFITGQSRLKNDNVKNKTQSNQQIVDHKRVQPTSTITSSKSNKFLLSKSEKSIVESQIAKYKLELNSLTASIIKTVKQIEQYDDNSNKNLELQKTLLEHKELQVQYIETEQKIKILENTLSKSVNFRSFNKK